MCATWKRRLGEELDLCVVCMCCTGKVVWKGTSLIAHSNILSQVSAQLIPVSRPISDSPLVWSFSTALFLNSHCMINTFPSTDVILIQRLFYWHYLLLTIYWSNIMMLVLYHYYFTVKLLHCHTGTNLYICFFLPRHSKCKRHHGNNVCMKYRMQWLIKRSGIDMTRTSLKCYPTKYWPCSWIERGPSSFLPSKKWDISLHQILSKKITGWMHQLSNNGIKISSYCQWEKI